MQAKKNLFLSQNKKQNISQNYGNIVIFVTMFSLIIVGYYA